MPQALIEVLVDAFLSNQGQRRHAFCASRERSPCGLRCAKRPASGPGGPCTVPQVPAAAGNAHRHAHTSAPAPHRRRLCGHSCGRQFLHKTGALRTLLATTSTHRLVTRHQFLARPRRFGKTLLIDTLEAWFQGLPPGHRANPEGDTEPLEGLPAGWTSPPWLWEGLDAEDWHGTHGWHPVIRLNLSRAAASSPAGTLTYLQNYLHSVIRLWRRRSGRRWLGTEAPPTASPAELLATLVEDLTEIYEPEPVVLVDEYDAPIVNHIGTDRSLEPAVAELREFIRVLKDDEGLLYGVFVTGITRFARHHLFSAANNFVDISDEPGYRALLQALFLLMAVPTQSEPSNWGGRSDHEVQIGNRVYVFEVKYNQFQDAALRQIRDRQYGRQHLGTGRTVTVVGLAFRRDLQTGPCLQVAQADLARLLTAGAEDVPRERRRRCPPG